MRINMHNISKELLDKIDQLIALEDQQAKALFILANTHHHYQDKIVTSYVDANWNKHRN